MKVFVLGAALVASPCFAQSSDNPMRQAYPACFETFPDEKSSEHSICVEIAARNPQVRWTKDNLEEAVRLEVGRQKDAAFAEEKLQGRRGDPSALEFKGIALGLDLATIKATNRYSCSDPKSPIGDIVCNLRYGERETIAGAPLKLLTLAFYNERLHYISVLFDEKDFSTVSSALIEKYGQTQVKSETLQNRMGATFENKIFNWARTGGSVEARRYSTKLDTSAVRWQSDSYIKEFAARRKSTTRSSAKDL
jgi:hypothetical protein